jgi:hypothetical protein
MSWWSVVRWPALILGALVLWMLAMTVIFIASSVVGFLGCLIVGFLVLVVLSNLLARFTPRPEEWLRVLRERGVWAALTHRKP